MPECSAKSGKNNRISAAGMGAHGRGRALIALGKTKEAKERLNAEDMSHGMSQFYKVRKVELLGICAMIEGDEKALQDCEKELVILKDSGCGCCNLNDTDIVSFKRLERDWARTKTKLVV